MTRKNDSLAYPADPLAAIRELQALDARPGGALPVGRDPVAQESPPGGPRSPSRRQPGPPPTPATRSAVRPHPAGREPTNSSYEEPGGRGDFIGEAVRTMLAQPYSSDPGKGPFTVSTVKIPTEIWERLCWVSAWTARPKQEIIADALKDHFVKFLKGG